MIVLTQLVYVHPGKEAVFHEFEDAAIRILAKHGGELLLRLRPNPESVVTRSIDVPYEIHLVRFPSEEDLARFSADEDRQKLLHLKQVSVRLALLVKGTMAAPA